MRNLVFLTALLTYSGLLSATPITYTLSVDTSSLAGTEGSLDFNFNPGPLLAQSATVQIINFQGGMLLPPATLTGDASGSLPTIVTLDNGAFFNDYFEDIRFGSTLSFGISLSGPALSAPNGIATSGSTFSFSVFADPAGTAPALSSDLTDGFAYVVYVNLDGSTTVTDYLTTLAPTPEPSTLLFMVGLLVLLLAYTLTHRGVEHRASERSFTQVIADRGVGRLQKSSQPFPVPQPQERAVLSEPEWSRCRRLVHEPDSHLLALRG